MTLPADPVVQACPACGHLNTLESLLSTHTFGSPDLDLRPAADLRNWLHLEVEVCDACGYAAEALSASLPSSARAVMVSDAWADLSHAGLPPLALRFKRAELIHAADGAHRIAAWMALKAAWACDDAKDPIHAPLRLQAASRIEALRSQGDSIVTQSGGLEVLLADLHRRAGALEAARNWIWEGRMKAELPVIQAILALESRLVAASDIEVHQVIEAQGYS